MVIGGKIIAYKSGPPGGCFDRSCTRSYQALTSSKDYAFEAPARAHKCPHAPFHAPEETFEGESLGVRCWRALGGQAIRAGPSKRQEAQLIVLRALPSADKLKRPCSRRPQPSPHVPTLSFPCASVSFLGRRTVRQRLARTWWANVTRGAPNRQQAQLIVLRMLPNADRLNGLCSGSSRTSPHSGPNRLWSGSSQIFLRASNAFLARSRPIPWAHRVHFRRNPR